jgi:hypothetical protein
MAATEDTSKAKGPTGPNISAVRITDAFALTRRITEVLLLAALRRVSHGEWDHRSSRAGLIAGFQAQLDVDAVRADGDAT